MNFNWKKFVLGLHIISALFAFAFLLSEPILAQSGKGKPKKMQSQAADPNIKSDERANSPNGIEMKNIPAKPNNLMTKGIFSVERGSSEGMLKAEKGTDASKPDPNIREAGKPNTLNNSMVDPLNVKNSKNAEQRSNQDNWCNVQLNNRTSYFIKLYLNGNYAGTVGPYGYLYSWITKGPTTFYARADFVDGTYLYWGPKDPFNCQGSYIWTSLP